MMTGDDTPPPGDRTPLAIVGGLLAAMFLFAFIAAPHSCQWGLNAWFFTGLLVGLTCVALPLRFAWARLVNSPVGSAAILGAA